ncbi:MAG TPA: hypothetical protein DIU15_01670, partial [Deltaproteobacteria bacterium]|nr:hypothetical protein [Deltaproteobacteria bacterium]
DDDDDDDDTAAEFALAAISFSIEMEAVPVDDSSTDISAVFGVNYWAEYNEATQILNCTQWIQIAGSATFGPGILAGEGCNNCTGSIEFDHTSATDISDPATNPDDCDVAELDLAGANFGPSLLTPITDGGMGDFLSLGLVDVTTMSDQGMELTVDGGYSAAEIEQTLSEYGLEFT